MREGGELGFIIEDDLFLFYNEVLGLFVKIRGVFFIIEDVCDGEMIKVGILVLVLGYCFGY